MIEKIKYLAIGLAIPIVVFIGLLMFNVVSFKDNANNSTNVIAYTNTIYEIRPDYLNPVVSTNTNGEVCLDATQYGLIYNDYFLFSTTNFIVWESNNILTIQLHKRQVAYKIPKKEIKRWTVGVGYSFGSTIPVGLYLGYELFDNIGLWSSSCFDRLTLGLYMRF